VTRINNVAANQTINVLESASTPPALSGDYNQNNKVDAADYVLFRKTLGSSVPASSGADGNGNGTVDQADYNVWRTHFGASLPASGASTESQSSSAQLLASAQETDRRAASVRDHDMALAALDHEGVSWRIAVSNVRLNARRRIAKT
jgi:hypothetical protein